MKIEESIVYKDGFGESFDNKQDAIISAKGKTVARLIANRLVIGDVIPYQTFEDIFAKHMDIVKEFIRKVDETYDKDNA